MLDDVDFHSVEIKFVIYFLSFADSILNYVFIIVVSFFISLLFVWERKEEPHTK